MKCRFQYYKILENITPVNKTEQKRREDGDFSDLSNKAMITLNYKF